MTFKMMAAVVATAAALATAPALSAQSIPLPQLTDRSGAITMQFSIAKWVEVVSDAPSTHNLTGNTDGVTPGVGLIDMADGVVTREIRANTMYRLSVEGVAEGGGLEFVPSQGASGSGIVLNVECKLSDTETPASPNEYELFDCGNSGPMAPTASSWVTLRAFSDNAQATEGFRAGMYQATVYIQIEAL